MATSSLLIPESPLTVLPGLAVRIGLNEAIFLQQVQYWISREAGFLDEYGRRWIYNTVKQWRDQFPFWSESTIKRTIRSLEEQNVVISTMIGNQFNKTKAYTIDYDRIEELSENIVHEQVRSSMESAQVRVSVPPPARKGGEYTEEYVAADVLKSESLDIAPSENDEEGQNVKTSEPHCGVNLTPHGEQDEPRTEVNLTPRTEGAETPVTARVWTPSSRARVTETTTENTHRIRETTTSDVRAFCASLGVPSLSTEKFIQRYGENLLQEKARLLETAMQTQSIRNPAGWLNAALKNGYTFSPGNSQRESVPEQKDPPRPYVPPASVSVPTTRKTTVKRDVQEVLSLQAGEGSEFAKEFLRRKNADGRASP